MAPVPSPQPVSFIDNQTTGFWLKPELRAQKPRQLGLFCSFGTVPTQAYEVMIVIYYLQIPRTGSEQASSTLMDQ